MSFFSRVFGGAPATVERKSENITTSAGLLNYFEGRGGDPVLTSYDRHNVQAVYGKNPIAYQCVSLIARQFASVDLIIKKGDTEIDDPKNALRLLMQRPNRTTSGARFMEELASHLLLFGNAYIIRSKINGSDPYGLLRRGKGEMRLLDPKLMDVRDTGKMFPDSYVYTAQGEQRTFPVNQMTGECELLHLKTYNPMDPYRGLPAASSAYLAILNHNEGQLWNYRSLVNNAVPAMAITMRDGAGVTREQASQIRDDFMAKYGGANNSGKVAVLGEMDVEILGFDPTKMQYTAGQEAAARNIALAFGVSPMLLGLPGDNTFSNMEGAVAALYQQRVLPLLDYVLNEMNVWMADVFGSDFEVTYDLDSVAALESKRREKWQALKDISFLTVNEKRASLGYDPVPGGDEIIGVAQPDSNPTRGQDPQFSDSETNPPEEKPVDEPVTEDDASNSK